jgi:hypothetical protein
MSATFGSCENNFPENQANGDERKAKLGARKTRFLVAMFETQSKICLKPNTTNANKEKLEEY